MNNKYALQVNNVSKHFFLPSEKHDTLIEYISHPFRAFNKKNKNKLKVLKQINFNVEKGEFLGVIGRNGAGKSTLLKIISGIYLPDSGRIDVNGLMVPFLELGVGFDPELTARDNIYLNGVILGMTKKEVNQKFDEIVEFSELEKFLDMPLKNFSSGMQVRLAFSIAIKSYADIYIMDEVLAVGDSSFQKKCFAEFESFRSKSKTVVFVSHALDLVRDFCDRVILIDNGEIAKKGDPNKVVDLYEKIQAKKEAEKE